MVTGQAIIITRAGLSKEEIWNGHGGGQELVWVLITAMITCITFEMGLNTLQHNFKAALSLAGRIL